MAGLSFGGTIDVLKDAMQGAGAAHAAYAHNVANVNTPDFHRSEVSFKDKLAEVAGLDGGEETLTLATTSPNDVTAGDAGFSPETTVDDATRMRQDGNNVDVDQEMAKLSMNADYGSTSASFLKNQYAMLRQVITG